MKRLSFLISTMVFGFMISTMYITSAKAADINVPDDYSTIQGAIDASGDGDVVIVDLGTYVEHIIFSGKAITVKSIDPYDSDVVANTVIDGNQGGFVVNFSNAEDHDTIISGVTIRNGKNGIYCHCSSPTIINCIVSKNLKGISCEFSSAIITDCIISENSNSGVFCYGSSPAITNCNITKNSARFGGGIYCHNSTFTITNCSITENLALENGGGIHSEWIVPLLSEESWEDVEHIHWAFVLMIDSPHKGIFLMPWAIADFLGGIFIYDISRITNCIIAQNSAASGGGISFLSKPPSWAEKAVPPYPNPIITNCTITENIATSSGGGIFNQFVIPIITNCILWENYPTEIFGKHLKIRYSDVQGRYFGIGNINADPLFVDPEAGNYHLQPDSPCIERGKRRCDMGAYGTYEERMPWRRSGRYLRR